MGQFVTQEVRYQSDTLASTATRLQEGERLSSEPTSFPPSQSQARDREQLLTQAYQTYGHLVLRICREILRQQQDAEDAMHETFLKYWRYAERISDPKETIALLRRIALSTAIDFLRSRQRQGKYGDAWHEIHEIMHTSQSQEHEQENHAKQLVSLLLQAVRVDDDTLTMTYHYYFDEMTLEEVAEYTGYSRRSVGMKLQKFRENAAKYCRNHNISW